MTAWHVDEQGRKWRPFKLYTCPNHPDGPVTLPAEGYEREELTLEQAYDHEELVDLMAVVTAAKVATPESAARVEQMLGLCCLGQRWKVAGFQQVRQSEVTLSSLSEMLHAMRGPVFPPSILVHELTRDEGGIVVRIPLIEAPDG